MSDIGRGGSDTPAMTTERRYSNYEADVLCAVPLALAEAVQAAKDVLIPTHPDLFDAVKQRLVANADERRDRDPRLRDD